MTKRKVYLTPSVAEEVLAKMKPGVACTTFNLAQDFGATTQDMRHWLRDLEAEGKVQACGERYLGSAFRLAEHKVQPPYVNLRLDEDLVGYNSTLRSHERLAMLTRR